MKSFKNFKTKLPTFVKYLDDQMIQIMQLVEIENSFVLLLMNEDMDYLICTVDANNFNESDSSFDYEVVDIDEKYCDPRGEEFASLYDYATHRFLMELSGATF